MALSSKALTITPLMSVLLALLFIISSLHTSFVAASSNSTSNSINSLKTFKSFIKKYCNTTAYPKVCCKSLSPYASVIKTDPLILTKSSIYITLKSISKACSSLRKLSYTKNLTHNETLVVRDCLENVYDSLDEVKQSAMAIKDLNGTSTNDEKFQWSNIKTWMSAAITDQVTCLDEFDEMVVRAPLQKKIKTYVTNVRRMISNALSLVNKYTYH